MIQPEGVKCHQNMMLFDCGGYYILPRKALGQLKIYFQHESECFIYES